MKPDTLFYEGRREGGRMWSLILPGPDCFVGDEPGVAPAAAIDPLGVLPACDVRFVGIGNPGGSTIEWNGPGPGEVEHELVAVVHISLRIDRLEVACTDNLVIAGLDGNRLDPVEGVLELEEIGRGQRKEQLVG